MDIDYNTPDAALPETRQIRPMEVRYECEGYNPRRYGRPWIAKIVAWPVGGKAALKFGASYSHFAEIEAMPGDVVRYGQKDLRGRNSLAVYAVVQEDGTLTDIGERGAMAHFRARAAKESGE